MLQELEYNKMGDQAKAGGVMLEMKFIRPKNFDTLMFCVA